MRIQEYQVTKGAIAQYSLLIMRLHKYIEEITCSVLLSFGIFINNNTIRVGKLNNKVTFMKETTGFIKIKMYTIFV